MKKELNIFFTALMFYTRIPCPKWVGYSQENLNKATKYFPLIGWIIGGFAAFVLWFSSYVFPVSIAVILSMITCVLITGAFHEDGFADTCDGFGGGWTQEKILEIMKDSRSGAYGVIGMFLILLLKFFLIFETSEIDLKYALMSLFLAHVLSRFSAVYITFTENYVRADEQSKVKPIAKKLDFGSFIVAALWVIPPFIVFQNSIIFLVIIPVFLMTLYLKSYFKKWIGGFTGDCLGATQQVNEIVILLSCLGLWKFF